MQEIEFDYNGKKLFYRTAGSGPVVVLLHGFGEDGTIWRNQFDLFPNHQLIVPDLPGSGRSEAIDDMSMEGLAEALHALVEGLTPGPSPRGEGGEDSEKLDLQDDSQKETGHYFKTGDTVLWKTTKEYGHINRKNPTEAEDLLWQNLRNNKQGIKFRRQHSIGGFIVDFAALEIKLVIEVDGGYHDNPEQQSLNQARQRDLEQHGYSVVRFANEEVLHRMSNVLQKIRIHISDAKEKTALSGTPPLSAEKDLFPLPFSGGEGGQRPDEAGVGGEAILIGHSMGGYVTLAFAEKYPEAVTASGLFHSTAFADSEERKQKRRDGIAAMKAAGAEAFLETFVPGLYSTATKTGRPGAIDEHLTSVHNLKKETLVSYFEAMMNRPDRTALLKESKVPVLFVMGKHDTAVPVEDSLKQCHLPQLAYIHLLQNSAHAGMVEEAEEANRILEAFIKAVENKA